jgi:hypothetical protein
MPKIRSALMCALMVAGLTLAITPAAEATTVSSAPIDFPTTDGDILTTTVMYLGGYTALAIGGNFTHITRPVKQADGTTKTTVVAAAKNLAVLRIPDGALLYAGNVNSYVRATYAINGRLYVGGSFTSIDGQARTRAASLTAPGWQVTPFAAPGVGTVYSITAGGSTGIVLGSSSSVRSFNPDTSTQRWTLPVTGGAVRTMLTVPNMYAGTDVVYVGGQFEKVGDFTQHGLVRLGVTAASTFVDHAFAPYLRPDSASTYDGQEVLSLGIKQPDQQLMVGWGGGYTNGIGAVTMEYSHWWWQRTTPGDLQALAVLPTTTVIGYHRNHVNDDPWQQFGEGWYGSEVDSSSSAVLPWTPDLSGLTPGNADGGNHGIVSMAVDMYNSVLIVGGGFTTYGQNCDSAVFPCTNAAGSRRQSLALYRIAA